MLELADKTIFEFAFKVPKEENKSEIIVGRKYYFSYIYINLWRVGKKSFLQEVHSAALLQCIRVYSSDTDDSVFKRAGYYSGGYVASCYRLSSVYHRSIHPYRFQINPDSVNRDTGMYCSS